MKKAEKAIIINVISTESEEELKSVLRTLQAWESNHRDVKASYFWHPYGNSSARAREAARRSWDDALSFGDVKISYVSDCDRISCSNYYWRDSLDVEGEKMGDANISFADINFIIEAIDELLSKRS